MSNKAKVYPQYNGVNPKYVEARNKCNEVVTYKGNCSDIKECGSCCVDCKFWLYNDPDYPERKRRYIEETCFNEARENKLKDEERKVRNALFPDSKRLFIEDLDRDLTVFEISELYHDLDKEKSVKSNNKELDKEETPMCSTCNIYNIKTSQLEKCKSFRLKENVSNG